MQSTTRVDIRNSDSTKVEVYDHVSLMGLEGMTATLTVTVGKHNEHSARVEVVCESADHLLTILTQMQASVERALRERKLLTAMGEEV